MDVSPAHSSRLVTTAYNGWQDGTLDTQKPTVTAHSAAELFER